MKKTIVLCGLIGLVPGFAQAPDSATDLSTYLRQERDRLSLERSQAGNTYTEALKRCYQEIAVNACKQRAQDIKNLTNNQIRRQEIQLNQREREKQSQDAQVRLKDKQSQETQDKEAERRGKTQQEHADALKRNLDKNNEYQDKQAQAEENLRQRQQHVEEVLKRQQSHADKAAASDKARADYQRKLQEAQAHREQILNDRAKRNADVAPLPPSPAKLP